jgi:hypothetical protein
MRAVALLLVLTAAQSLIAQCRDGRDGRSNHHGGWLIADAKIAGTETLASDVLSAIESEVIGTCVDGDTHEVDVVIRAAFQNKGYFNAEVGDPKVQVVDPFKDPRPISIEVVASEGALSRVGTIVITGNHAFSEKQLLSVFPVKKNDLFMRDKITSGFDRITELYGGEGYLDFWMATSRIHQATSSNVGLRLEIHEGTQYHIGKLAVAAKPELAEKLQQKWLLSEGTVFDRGYIATYLDANRALLPNDMVPERVQLVRDCPHGAVDVRVLVDSAVVASLPEAKNIECEDAAKASDAEGKPRSTN